MKVLVAGSNGMLARDLIAFLETDHEVKGAARPGFDITDRASVHAAVEAAAPEVVINCAADTAVDRAETESELAFGVNRKGPRNLASVCREAGALLVHISTDFVFDGKKDTPYRESDPTGPLNVYGRSKLEGEEKVLEILPGSIIVRTSWIYGRHGRNFPKTITRLALERDEICVVTNQVGSPTYTTDLSQALLSLIEAGKPGIYHFSNKGGASRYEFASEIIGILKQKGAALRLKTIRPVTAVERPAGAVRPAYTVLDTAKYTRVTGKAVAPWREALERFLETTSLGSLVEA
jgi:dTDP-4-dehydrorhamnose reductase